MVATPARSTTHDFVELYNPTASDSTWRAWSCSTARAATRLRRRPAVTSMRGGSAAGGALPHPARAGRGGSDALPNPDLIGTSAVAGGGGQVVAWPTARRCSTPPAGNITGTRRDRRLRRHRPAGQPALPAASYEGTAVPSALRRQQFGKPQPGRRRHRREQRRLDVAPVTPRDSASTGAPISRHHRRDPGHRQQHPPYSRRDRHHHRCRDRVVPDRWLQRLLSADRRHRRHHRRDPGCLRRSLRVRARPSTTPP